MTTQGELQSTVADLVAPGKGILAADESVTTISKRFSASGIESTDESRRAYRTLLFTSPGVEAFIAGIILYEETLGQSDDDGVPLATVLARRGILVGIKVDKGLVPLPGAPGDVITQGLDGLDERVAAYKAKGARFAKWRDVFTITERNPAALAVEANAEVLARYARVCQEQGVVPIVEPEVLIDGDHSLERCRDVSEEVLHVLFHALHRHRVQLECLVLKPSMVLPGKERAPRVQPDVVARETLAVLRRTVPGAVPSVNFLSGGQRPIEATANLNAMNRMGAAPWVLAFSYARALQDDALSTWAGRAENKLAAQAALLHRARMNSLARDGRWDPSMEPI